MEGGLDESLPNLRNILKMSVLSNWITSSTAQTYQVKSGLTCSSRNAHVIYTSLYPLIYIDILQKKCIRNLYKTIGETLTYNIYLYRIYNKRCDNLCKCETEVEQNTTIEKKIPNVHSSCTYHSKCVTTSYKISYIF